MADVPFSILEKYNQQLEESKKVINQLKIENELLSLKLENANLKNELEKNKIKEALKYSEEMELQVKTLESELLKMQSLKDEQEKINVELKNTMDAQEQEKQAFEKKLAEKDENIADLKNDHKAEMNAQNESSKQALESAMAELSYKHEQNLDETKKAFKIAQTDLIKKQHLEFKKVEEANKTLKDELAEKDKIIADLKADKNAAEMTSDNISAEIDNQEAEDKKFIVFEYEESNNENIKTEVQENSATSNVEGIDASHPQPEESSHRSKINNRKRNSSDEIINPNLPKKRNQQSFSIQNNSTDTQEINEVSNSEESFSDVEKTHESSGGTPNNNEELSEFEIKLNEILSLENDPRLCIQSLETYFKAGENEKKAFIKYFSNVRELITSNAYYAVVKFSMTMESGKKHELIISSCSHIFDQFLKTIGESIISFECKNILQYNSFHVKDFNLLIGPKLQKLYLHEKIGETSKTVVRRSRSITSLKILKNKNSDMLNNLPISCKKLTIIDYTFCHSESANLRSIEKLKILGHHDKIQKISPMLIAWSKLFPKQLKKIKFDFDIRDKVPLQDVLKEVKEIEKAMTQNIPKNLEGSINYSIRCYYPKCNERVNKNKVKTMIEAMNFEISISDESKFYHIFKINNGRLTLKFNFNLVAY